MDNRLKQCTKCKQELPVSEFYRANGKKSGYKSHCKKCVLKKAKETYYDQENYRRRTENHWKKQGIKFTLAEYDELFNKQNGKCGICGTTKNRNDTRFCVDHCHDTGQIRGLLCHDCNTSIGKLGDSKEGLMKALEYLDNALRSEE